jgi:iron complex outermembrane receptor protein
MKARPRRGLLFTVLCLLSAAMVRGQMERPLAWQQDLIDLQRESANLPVQRDRVAAIRQEIETWLSLHPDSTATLAAAPSQPWDREEVTSQIARLLNTVSAILAERGQHAFRLGVTVVNVTDSVSSLSPVADSIDSSELRARDAVSVNQAIDYLPGVSVDHKDPRNQTGISIHGFDTRQVPVYVDGIPIYVPYDGFVDLTRYLTNDIAEIQVAKGYSSPLSGPNGLGGAINLVTQEPRAKLEGDASIGTGPGNLLNSSLRLGSRWREFFAQGSVDWLQSDFYPISGNFALNAQQPDRDRVNSYQRDERFSGRVGWSPRSGDAYVFSYLNQKGSYGVPPYSGIDPPCPAGNNSVLYACVTPKYWTWPYWNVDGYYFNGSRSFGEANTLKFRAFYDQYRNSMAMYDDATYSTVYKANSSGISNFDDHSIGSSGEFTTRALARNVIGVSLFLKDDTHHEDGISYFPKNVPAISPWQQDRDRQTSFGVQDVITISPRLRATVGFSADRLNGLEAQDVNSAKTQIVPFQVQSICAPSSASDFTSCTDHVWSYNPLASISYSLGKSGTLFATFAGKSRFPTLKDRYSYKFGRALPNPLLKPEHAENWNFGYSRVLALRTVVQAELFRSDVRDAIENLIFPSPLCTAMKGFCMQAVNIGKEIREGADLAVRSTPFTRLTLDANYEYLNRAFVAGAASAFPMGTPRHKAVGTATVRAFRQALLLASARYVSGIVGTSDSNIPVPASKFATLDLGAMVPLRAGLSVQAGIKNVFDRNYDYMEGFPEEGRNWYLNLRYRF